MSGLFTDLYEVRMAASYLRRDMKGSATFSLFFRALPPGRGFLVAAGLATALDALERMRLTDDDLAYLAASGMPAASADVLRMSSSPGMCGRCRRVGSSSPASRCSR